MSTIVTPQLRTTLLLALVTSSLIVTTAQAEPFTNADAIDEAVSNLKPCDDDLSKPRDCTPERKRFIEEYQNAYAGDHLAQENIAWLLWKGDGEKGDLPYIWGPAEACAWQTIASHHPLPDGRDDNDVKNLICNNPSLHKYDADYPLPDANGQLRLQLREILPRIHAHKVHRVNVEEINFDVKRDGDEDHAGIGRD